MKIKKVVNLAWYVKNGHGHNYMYAQMVQSLLQKSGIEVITLVNVHCSKDILNAQKTFVPFFDLHVYEKYNKLALLKPFYNIFLRLLENVQFGKQIRKAVKRYKADNTIFFIQDIFRENFFSLSLALKKEKHLTIGLFRYSPFLGSYSHRKKPKLKNVLFRDPLLKKMLIQNSQFVLASDSQKILDHLYLFSHRNKGILFPIVNTDIQVKKKLGVTKNKKEFLCGILGVFAMNKGVDTILKALIYIDDNKIFDIHTIRLIFQKPKVISQWYLTFIKTLDERKIRYTIYESSLSKTEYFDFVNEIDICLLPYKLEDGYDTRTSGVFIDSVFYEKPFITTKDSWMHYECQDLIHSGLFIENNNFIDLALAIKQMTEKYDDFSKATLEKKKIMKQRHNENLFLKGFLTCQDKIEETL